MTWSNLMLPPITAHLWLAIRDQIKVADPAPTLAAILGGANRVYVEGKQPAGNEDTEDKAWGRVIVVPGLVPGGTAFSPGYATRLSFLVRSEFNSRERPNYDVNRSLELSQAAVFKRLQHWTWTPGASNEVMIAMGVTLDTMWEPVALHDPDQPGVVFMSSRYRVEATRPPT